jgi:hypothetical protein
MSTPNGTHIKATTKANPMSVDMFGAGRSVMRRKPIAPGSGNSQ